MAWELRSGRRVYYRSRRKGKRVLRDYFGGDAARLAAALDDNKRRHKKQGHDTVGSLHRQWDQTCERLDRLCDGTLLLLRAVRVMADGHLVVEGDRIVSTTPDELNEHLRDLVARAETGDKAVLPQVKQMIQVHPQIVDHFGDIAKVAADLWLSLYAGNNVLLAEATREKMVAWRGLLSGTNPSPLEILMIEQITVCWLQSHYAEAMYAQALEAKAGPAIVRELRPHQEEGQRNLIQSIKHLAELLDVLPMTPPGTLQLHVPDCGRTIAEDGS